MGSVIPGPVPAYSNPPINPQFYQPRQYFIEDVALGETTVVTTTVDHDYVVGQLTRLIIPQRNGCRQLNDVQSYVIAVPSSDQVELDLVSSGGDDFVSTFSGTQPQILAIGDIANGQINSSGRVNNIVYIPGSFINISPN